MSAANHNQNVSNSSIEDVDAVVGQYYPQLVKGVHAMLAVFGAMALQGRTKPLSLIFETGSGFGKTTVLQMPFPLQNSECVKYVYRSDKFTRKAFVSHACNVKADELSKIDLLPKLENKVLITKELAPIFRGRTEELQDNFSTLISVLDGKGFTSDSGMRGRRGYQRSIVFNWLGATTPLPASTHRLMSQLGTRLLFYEIPRLELTEEELLAYAARDDADHAETDCQAVVNAFLTQFFCHHPIGTVSPKSITFSPERLKALTRWAILLVAGRAEVKFEKQSWDWEPVSAMPAEGPFKVINYLKELARGHALICGRSEITQEDLDLVAEVALSSTPGHLRPIMRELKGKQRVNSSTVASICRVSPPTARRYLKELSLLGLGALAKGKPEDNQSDTLTLAEPFQWLKDS
jgi:hypothetical protein